MKHYLLFTFALLFLNPFAPFAQNVPGTEWEKVKMPPFYGWNQNYLDDLENYIVDSTATTGMMIIQDGRVIYEYGNTSENSYIASCRKSILAMLFGTYVENGTIDLNSTLADLEITYDGMLLEKETEATVKDIISSRSGIYLPAANPGDMTNLAPPRGTVQPGELWIYNNWDFNMAGHIFEKLTQKNIYDEVETRLATPLQMQDWDRASQNKSGAAYLTDVLAYHMNFSTRDMARLGLLMLNKGQWNTQQLIPEFWVDEIVKAHTTSEEVQQIAPFIKNEFTETAYGYMWWLWHNPSNKALENAYSAQGAYGQNITVIPAINAVVVIKTNDLYQRQKGDHYFMIDLIAKAYDHQLKEELKGLATYLTQNDIQQFSQEYKKMPPNSEGVDFQDNVNQLAYYYLRERKEYDKALSLFELNATQNPTSWLVYDGLGECYLLRGNLKKAIQNYERALSLNENNQWNYNEQLTYIIKRLRQKE